MHFGNTSDKLPTCSERESRLALRTHKSADQATAFVLQRREREEQRREEERRRRREMKERAKFGKTASGMWADMQMLRGTCVNVRVVTSGACLFR